MKRNTTACKDDSHATVNASPSVGGGSGQYVGGEA